MSKEKMNYSFFSNPKLFRSVIQLMSSKSLTTKCKIENDRNLKANWVEGIDSGLIISSMNIVNCKTLRISNERYSISH